VERTGGAPGELAVEAVVEAPPPARGEAALEAGRSEGV